MKIQIVLLIITITGVCNSSNIRDISAELDSTVSLRCEIAQLPSNAVITWVYRPKIPTKTGIRWLPLYANARRLTQNNQRFIVDYAGYNSHNRIHSSILTINHLNISDEGVYMCKSNQHQSVENTFNLILTPSMKLVPHSATIEIHPTQTYLNVTCTVQELPAKTIDPLKIKWYHNKQEINQKQHLHLINKFPHYNQATLTLRIRHLSLNDTGLFTCMYDHGMINKTVHITHARSVLEYSKSICNRINSSCLSLFITMIIIFTLR